MNGVEVRIPVIESRDTELGTDNVGTQNAGSVELWHNGERIVELVWWEQDTRDLGSLDMVKEIYSAITVAGEVHHRTHQLRRRT